MEVATTTTEAHLSAIHQSLLQISARLGRMLTYGCVNATSSPDAVVPAKCSTVGLNPNIGAVEVVDSSQQSTEATLARTARVQASWKPTAMGARVATSTTPLSITPTTASLGTSTGRGMKMDELSRSIDANLAGIARLHEGMERRRESLERQMEVTAQAVARISDVKASAPTLSSDAHHDIQSASPTKSSTLGLSPKIDDVGIETPTAMVESTPAVASSASAPAARLLLTDQVVAASAMKVETNLAPFTPTRCSTLGLGVCADVQLSEFNLEATSSASLTPAVFDGELKHSAEPFSNEDYDGLLTQVGGMSLFLELGLDCVDENFGEPPFKDMAWDPRIFLEKPLRLVVHDVNRKKRLFPGSKFRILEAIGSDRPAPWPSWRCYWCSELLGFQSNATVHALGAAQWRVSWPWFICYLTGVRPKQPTAEMRHITKVQLVEEMNNCVSLWTLLLPQGWQDVQMALKYASSKPIEIIFPQPFDSNSTTLRFPWDPGNWLWVFQLIISDQFLCLDDWSSWGAHFFISWCDMGIWFYLLLYAPEQSICFSSFPVYMVHLHSGGSYMLGGAIEQWKEAWYCMQNWCLWRMGRNQKQVLNLSICSPQDILFFRESTISLLHAFSCVSGMRCSKLQNLSIVSPFWLGWHLWSCRQIQVITASIWVVLEFSELLAADCYIEVLSCAWTKCDHNLSHLEGVAHMNQQEDDSGYHYHLRSRLFVFMVYQLCSISTLDGIPWDPGGLMEAEFEPLLGDKQCFAGAVM